MKEKTFYNEKRPWGHYTLFVDNNKCSVKIHEISGQFSLQSHKHREEVWHVISGEVIAYKGSVKDTVEETKRSLKAFHLKAGDNIFIQKNHAHYLKNIGSKPALILEILEGDYDEYDEVRYEDVYGRV